DGWGEVDCVAGGDGVEELAGKFADPLLDGGDATGRECRAHQLAVALVVGRIEEEDRLGAGDVALAVGREHTLARAERGRVAGDARDVVMTGDGPQLGVVVPQHRRLGPETGERRIRVDPELGVEDVHGFHGKRELSAMVKIDGGWYMVNQLSTGERRDRSCNG